MTAPWTPRGWERSVAFWPLSAATARFSDHGAWPSVAEIDAALSARAGVRFVEQPPRPRRRDRRRGMISYDASICEQGIVPTRPGSWHDFFNALVWATFPRSKKALHERQHQALSRALRPAGGRTREQDGLALADEGGIVLLCVEGAVADVRAVLDARDQVSIARVAARGETLSLVFGHAIYEHLAAGLPPVRAMVHVTPCSAVPATRAGCVDLADDALAASLGDATSFQRPETFRSVWATAEVLGSPPVDGDAGRPHSEPAMQFTERI